MAKKDKLNQLVDTEVKEMSLVPRGANEKKDFLILKGEKGMSDKDEKVRTFDEILKDLVDHPDGPGLFEKPEEVENLIKELSDKEKSVVKAAARLLGTIKDKGSEKVVRQLNAMLGFGNPEKEVDKPKPDGEEDKGVKKEDDKLKKEDIAALPVEVQKALDEKEAKIEALQKSNSALSETVIKEQEIRKRSELIAKAEKSYSHIPGTSEELADLMLKASPEVVENLDKIFGAVNSQLEESELLKTAGSDAPGATTAEGKIESLTKALQAKDSNLTHAQAYNKVLEDNPELYAQYESEVH